MVPTGACGMLAMHRPANRRVMIPLPPTDEHPHEPAVEHRHHQQSAHLADPRRHGEAGRHRSHPDRPASVGAVLAAVAFRRIRRFGNVVLVVHDRDWAGRRPFRRAADLHHAAVLSHHDPGQPQVRHRDAGRSQGQARRRAGISADRGAVDARRAAARIRRHPKDMEFWMERTPEKSHGGATGFKPPPGVVVQSDSRRQEHRLDDARRRARRGGALSRPAATWSTAAAWISRTIPISNICFPTRPPRASATTARPGFFRSITRPWSGATSPRRSHGWR